MTKKQYAIIVAGGKGTRLKSAVPKQFLELAGKPILLHTIEAFLRYNTSITVILVLPQDDFGIWNEIVRKYKFNHSVILQQGGASRFQSVKNGLSKIVGEGLVAVHDGVRPLATTDMIAKSFEMAAAKGSAVAAVALKESIRVTEGHSTRALDRSKFQLIQTPQTFDVSKLAKAYEVKEEDSLTDDASVFERAGNVVHLYEGSYANIKITTPEDLVIAEALLKFHQ